jgi:hypothetical protein
MLRSSTATTAKYGMNSIFTARGRAMIEWYSASFCISLANHALSRPIPEETGSSAVGENRIILPKTTARIDTTRTIYQRTFKKGLKNEDNDLLPKYFINNLL